MAADYKTTVTTLRKALSILQQKGMLERIHGSGNYVRKVFDVDSVYAMFRLELCNGSGLPSAHLLDVRQMLKTPCLPKFGKSNTGTRIRRLRFLDKIPIALEEIWLDSSVGLIDPKKLQDSLYRYYKTQLNIWISHVEDKVSISQIPDWSPADFDPRIGEQAGYIERFSWAQSKRPIEFSRTWFDANKANYVQRLR